MPRTRDIADKSQLERELELEMEEDDELGDGADESTNNTDRFQRLSLREFESESEVDGAVQEILNAMEQEFFFGKLRKGWSRFKNKGLGRLVRKGSKLAGGRIPAVHATDGGLTLVARGHYVRRFHGPLGGRTAKDPV